VITVLWKSTDPWPRILAIRSTADFGLREFIPLLQQLQSGSNVLLCESAWGALAQFGEEIPMTTLKTVPIPECIVLLREIPIFADHRPRGMVSAKHCHLSPGGDEVSMIFVIVEGYLHVLRSIENTEQVLAERGSGDFVGEMAKPLSEFCVNAPMSPSLFYASSHADYAGCWCKLLIVDTLIYR
jgi:hypothetical protein